MVCFLFFSEAKQQCAFDLLGTLCCPVPLWGEYSGYRYGGGDAGVARISGAIESRQ